MTLITTTSPNVYLREFLKVGSSGIFIKRREGGYSGEFVLKIDKIFLKGGGGGALDMPLYIGHLDPLDPPPPPGSAPVSRTPPLKSNKVAYPLLNIHMYRRGTIFL